MALGFYIYPLPKGTEYTEGELKRRDKVIELFGYCGVAEGLITKEGWNFLINSYSYEELYHMDKEAMWFDGDSVEEYIDWVQYERESSLEN